jgi:ATP-dependent DNA helicase RecQ
MRGENPPPGTLNSVQMTSVATPTAEDHLRALAGPDATFREHQREAIEDLVVDRRRVLCVQRTGWGKSAVYFIATAMLRAAGEGPTLLISPLLALMRNQIDAAERLGLRAHTVNSTNRDDWDAVRDLIERDEVDLLLISPERLNNRRFRDEMLPLFARRVGLLVVDEAHCVSDWGHDFRPDYRRIRDALEQLRPGAAVLCTTATANDRVVADVIEQLGAGGAGADELRTYRGELARSSLRLEVVVLPSQAERLAWLARWLPEMPGSGIVYCLTKRDTESVAAWLNGRGISAVPYSGEVDDAARVEVERRLLANDVKAVVATSALGMGYDKPDLGFVVHYQAPGSAIAYYQQVGRAGRALDEAHAVLLRGVEDRDIQDYFIASAFPEREKAEAVVELIASSDTPVRMGELSGAVNLGQGRLTAMLKVLDVEGAVTQDGSGWVRTGEHWAYDSQRYQAVTALRRREQDAMERYGMEGAGCLMRALQVELDDPLAGDCGRCAACAGPRFGEPLAREVVVEAQEHLRSRPLELEPRKRWPPMNGAGAKAIKVDRQLRTGRALARSGDGGWDPLIRAARFGGPDARFSDELVRACVRVVDQWGPEPFPEWLTAVPSLRQPELVPEFGERLAAALGLPYLRLLTRVGDGPPQREMENSSQQALNVSGQFEVAAAPPSAAGLIVDDLWFSGWTLATLGAQLRDAGAGPLHPLVLSLAGR